MRDHGSGRYEHIVFDLDGTLVDSLTDLTEAVNHVRRRFGLPVLSRSIVSTYVGEGVRVLVGRALGPGRGSQLKAAQTLFMAHYRRHLLDHTRPYPGVTEALAALAARGKVLSVLSNKPAVMTRTLLKGVRLRRCFDAVIGGDSLRARKPQRAGLDHLRARFGTPAGRLLLVGDSLIDLRTARAGGVAFCGVAWGFNPAALRARTPELMIKHPRELLALVDA